MRPNRPAAHGSSDVSALIWAELDLGALGAPKHESWRFDRGEGLACVFWARRKRILTRAVAFGMSARTETARECPLPFSSFLVEFCVVLFGRAQRAENEY
jgi:hypothetical protein